MAGVKLPTNELAVKHLLITKNQHKTILKMASKENKRVSVILEEMLILYVSAQNELIYYEPENIESKLIDHGELYMWDYPNSIPE